MHPHAALPNRHSETDESKKTAPGLVSMMLIKLSLLTHTSVCRWMHPDLAHARNGTVPPFLLYDEGRSANADFYAAKMKQLEQSGVEHGNEKFMKMTALFNKCEAVQMAASTYFDVKEIVFENELGRFLPLGHPTVQKAMRNACLELWKKTQIPLHLAIDTMSAFYGRHFRAGSYKGVFKKKLNTLQGASKETAPVKFSGKNLPKSKKRQQMEMSSESEGPATKKKTPAKTAKRSKKTNPPKAVQKKSTPRAPPEVLKFVVGQAVAVGIKETNNVFCRGSIIGHFTVENYMAWEVDNISLVGGKGTHQFCAVLSKHVSTHVQKELASPMMQYGQKSTMTVMPRSQSQSRKKNGAVALRLDCV